MGKCLVRTCSRGGRVLSILSVAFDLNLRPGEDDAADGGGGYEEHSHEGFGEEEDSEVWGGSSGD